MMKAKVAEVVKENQLAVIVKESNLEPTKAKFILEKFTDYFEIASDWEKKAKAIVVTKETQTAEMAMAREGRLFLKEKRVAIEKARKELKEQALRERKAIDGIANVLKALIVPIEEHLERQERFVEIKKEEKEAVMRLEIEKRMEDERIAKEKADAEALEKARLENEKLRAEAVEREKKATAERKKQEELLAKERAKSAAERQAQEKKLAAERAKSEAERQAVEAEARAEREKREKTLANERARDKRLKEIADEKVRAEKEKERAKLEAEKKEKERLAEILKNQIECPACHHKFTLKKGA
jgi:hypothetical protein